MNSRVLASMQQCFFPGNISDDEIHVWCVVGEDLADVEFIRQHEEHLCTSERARAGRFSRRDDRNRFVMGRALLRRALGAYLATEPRSISFVHNQYGRPEIASTGPDCVRFNLSHTDGIVAAVFASRSEVGIDVEQIQPEFPHLDVARHHFPAANRAELERLPLSLSRTRFYDYWVLFEAYTKGRGIGLSLPFHKVGFAFDEIEPSRIYFTPPVDADSGSWRFWLGAPSNDCRLAVGVSGRGERLVVYRLRPGCWEPFCLHTVATSGNRAGAGSDYFPRS